MLFMTVAPAHHNEQKEHMAPNLSKSDSSSGLPRLGVRGEINRGYVGIINGKENENHYNEVI